MKKLNVGDKFHSPSMREDGTPHWYVVKEVNEDGYVLKDPEGIERYSFRIIHGLFEREDNPWTLYRIPKFEFDNELFEL